MTMIGRGAEDRREDARNDVSGQFGAQRHRESGIVETSYGPVSGLLSRAGVLRRKDWPAKVRFIDSSSGVGYSLAEMSWAPADLFTAHVLTPLVRQSDFPPGRADGATPPLLSRAEAMNRTDWPAGVRFVDAASGVSYSAVQMSGAPAGLFTAHTLTPLTH